MDCSDEWCYVDSETGSVRSPSFDVAEEEPELELEPMFIDVSTSPIIKSSTATTPSGAHDNHHDGEEEEDLNVLNLLRDSSETTPSPSPSTVSYSRDTMLSLLSPAHHRYVITRVAATQTTATKPVAHAERNVQAAFATPSRRLSTTTCYADRLRAAMPSRRESPASLAYGTTSVTSFTRDQVTQTETNEEPVVTTRSPRHEELLSSALDRSLRLSMQLSTKSQDKEKLEIRAMRLQMQLDDRSRENEAIGRELLTAQRGLRISQKRSELSDEFQDHLKREIQQLRDENQSLHQRIDVLAGGLDLQAKSVADLEQLEDTLEQAMTKIRRVLRGKYHNAIAGVEEPESEETLKTQNQEEDDDDSKAERCVVCLEKPACVRVEPCGHEVLCSECALRVTTCPVDRQQIQDKVLTHGLNAYA